MRRGERHRDTGRKEHTEYHERKGEEQEEHAPVHLWVPPHALFWATACLLCAVTFRICQMFSLSPFTAAAAQLAHSLSKCSQSAEGPVHCKHFHSAHGMLLYLLVLNDLCSRDKPWTICSTKHTYLIPLPCPARGHLEVQATQQPQPGYQCTRGCISVECAHGSNCARMHPEGCRAMSEDGRRHQSLRTGLLMPPR